MTSSPCAEESGDAGTGQNAEKIGCKRLSLLRTKAFGEQGWPPTGSCVPIKRDKRDSRKQSELLPHIACYRWPGICILSPRAWRRRSAERQTKGLRADITGGHGHFGHLALGFLSLSLVACLAPMGCDAVWSRSRSCKMLPVGLLGETSTRASPLLRSRVDEMERLVLRLEAMVAIR